MKYSTIKLIFLAAIILAGCRNENNPTEECVESLWYEDADQDGLGNPNASRSSCTQPVGYVENNDDNDDLNVENLTIPTTGYSSPDNYSGMTLSWSDEFDGNLLDENKWNFQLGSGCPDLCGWGNNELQYYKEESTTLQDGYLIITIKKIPGDEYNSSRINTQGKFAFTYGRVDVRAALPEGQGIWPAIWMLGENIDEVGWPKSGEIDIMEKIGGVGNEHTVYGTTHWDNAGSHASYGGSKDLGSVSLKNEFHVYSIIWNEQHITWLVDNEPFHEIDITPAELSEFHEDFHLLINCAVGGNWPGNPDASTSFAQYMIIDYVRVFQ